jgi:hypothetical protein
LRSRDRHSEQAQYENDYAHAVTLVEPSHAGKRRKKMALMLVYTGERRVCPRVT